MEAKYLVGMTGNDELQLPFPISPLVEPPFLPGMFMSAPLQGEGMLNATVIDLIVPLLREKVTLNLLHGATLTVGVEGNCTGTATGLGTRDLSEELMPLVFPECPEALLNATGHPMSLEEMNCTNETVNPYDFPYKRELSPLPYNKEPPYVTGQTHASVEHLKLFQELSFSGV